MLITRRKMAALTASAAFVPGIAQATMGPVLLTVSGNVTEGTVQFDREMLEALDWREIETFTSFTSGPQRFAGPTLASVLNAVGAEGATLKASAINDYTVAIPVADAFAHDVLLAMDHNGRPMRIRDKGPIWVVYPLSEDDAAAQKRDAEMIWQLSRIVVE